MNNFQHFDYVKRLELSILKSQTRYLCVNMERSSQGEQVNRKGRRSELDAGFGYVVLVGEFYVVLGRVVETENFKDFMVD